MLAKSFALVSFVALAAAAPQTFVNQCNTGPAQCCNSVQSASSSSVAEIFGLLGLNLQNINGLVGFTCNPVGTTGVGQGSNCAQQPVCCENNNFNGLVNIGCSPISL